MISSTLNLLLLLLQALYTCFFSPLQGMHKLFFTVNFQQQFFTLCKRCFLSFFGVSPSCLFYSLSENKMLVIKFDVNWNVHWKHISFMALFYLPTAVGAALGHSGLRWATLAAFPHCAARTLFIVNGNRHGPWVHSKVQEEIIILTCGTTTRTSTSTSSWPLAASFC